MQTPSARSFIPSLLLLLAGSAILVAGFAPHYPVSHPGALSTPIPTPPSFTPASSKIGLHTRLTDEPDPANITREFHMLRDMGATWATEFFPWAYIQPSDKLRFDWEHADLVANAA